MEKRGTMKGVASEANLHNLLILLANLMSSSCVATSPSQRLEAGIGSVLMFQFVTCWHEGVITNECALMD